MAEMEELARQSGQKGCAFCGGLGHRIADCPKLAAQVRQDPIQAQMRQAARICPIVLLLWNTLSALPLQAVLTGPHLYRRIGRRPAARRTFSAQAALAERSEKDSLRCVHLGEAAAGRPPMVCLSHHGHQLHLARPACAMGEACIFMSCSRLQRRCLDVRSEIEPDKDVLPSTASLMCLHFCVAAPVQAWPGLHSHGSLATRTGHCQPCLLQLVSSEN